MDGTKFPENQHLPEEVIKQTESEILDFLRYSNEKFFSIKEILNLQFEEKRFLIEKLIPHPSITAISGHPGVGKSWLILEMAKSIASGEKFLGQFETLQSPVAIIDEEMGLRTIQERIKSLGIPQGLPIYFLSQPSYKIDKKRDLEDVIDKLIEKRVKVVFIDPFTYIHSGVENSAEDMTKVMEGLTEFTKNDITVIFAHHHRKEIYLEGIPGQSLRGSSVIFARLDSLLMVKKEEDTPSGFVISISQEKLRTEKQILPFKVELFKENETEQVSLSFLGFTEPETLEKNKVKMAILELLNAPTKRQDLIQTLSKSGFSVSTIDRGLKELVAEGRISKRKDGREVVFEVSQEDKSEEISDLFLS